MDYLVVQELESERQIYSAEIISIGTELLLGQIVNTNARDLACELSELGISNYYQAVVGDNPERMEAVIRQGLGVVILSLQPAVWALQKMILPYRYALKLPAQNWF